MHYGCENESPAAGKVIALRPLSRTDAEQIRKFSQTAMTLFADKAAFQNTLAGLAVVTYESGATVIADGSRTGQLLILKTGAVVILKNGTEIAEVGEAGAVFGELSVLLDQPHTADVRALRTSQFYVTDAAALLTKNPAAALYVATVLAGRLNAANHAFIRLRNELQSGEPRKGVVETLSRLEQVFSSFGWGALMIR
jgi:CRP-like cAMP-binding protein